MRCGLIGEKLKHSYSKEVHEFFDKYDYDLYPIEESKLENFLNNGKFNGLNVTIPYKKAVIPFLDYVFDDAEKIGSVNTIVFKDGKKYGYNTDYYGFKYLAESAGISFLGKKILILGSGGTSLTAKAVCKDCNASQIIVISRHGENNYKNINLHYDAEVIINTTPLGMFPDVENMPDIDLKNFKNLTGVIDCIYNPLKTRLILQAEERKIPAVGGLKMLIAQAKKSCEYFCGENIDDQIIEKIYSVLSKRIRNIALIGMPGCGKSSVGAVLAEMTGRKIIDIDAKIEEEENLSIPEIFEKYGENYFRDREEEVLLNYAKENGLIIACGGGIIKRKRNILNLKMNSSCVFINRNPLLLPTDGRPLSQNKDAVLKLCEERLPIYNKIADITVENEIGIEDTAERIRRKLDL